MVKEYSPEEIAELGRQAEEAPLRDQFALAIAPDVVKALSPAGYGQKGEWGQAKVIGNTVYAIADALIAARRRKS